MLYNNIFTFKEAELENFIILTQMFQICQQALQLLEIR